MTTRAPLLWRAIPVLLLLAALSSCSHHRVQTDQPTTTLEADDMAPAAHVHHAIDYIEFTVTDMAEAKRFYHAAFGWEFNDYGPDYAGIRKEGGEAGGLRLDTTASTGGPLVVLYSTDLDLTLANVREAGGRIVTEPFDFPGGRRFHFADPTGNELAVYAVR